jgi:hypothetical protein
VTVAGRDAGLVRRVDFRLGRRHVARDSRAPFTRRMRIGAARLAVRAHARVTLVDGRRLRLHRALRPCAKGRRG